MGQNKKKPGPPWWWVTGLFVKVVYVLTWFADRFGQDV